MIHEARTVPIMNFGPTMLNACPWKTAMTPMNAALNPPARLQAAALMHSDRDREM